MSFRLKVALGLLAVLAVGGYAAWQQYWYYLPGLIQAITDPIEANHPVQWAAGPAAPATDAAAARPISSSSWPTTSATTTSH